jgi:SAM-dependent methyltransferase
MRRSAERVLEHYKIERGLADRLRDAPADQRARVYGEVYDELFRSVPDHPQLSMKPDYRKRIVRDRFRFVSRFLDENSCLMEIGAGDGEFSINAAPAIRRGILVDVSEVILPDASGASNLEVVISDGVSFPVEDASVDVAFSDNLMEHLHPDDAAQQLLNVARVVRPGGVYICITPNRVYGPHDVSRGFDDIATGFHLREYTGRELRRMLLGAGFRRVDFYIGGRGRYLRLPAPVALLAEAAFALLPKSLRRAIPELPKYVIFGLNVVAIR